MALKATDMVGEEWAHYPGEVEVLYYLAESLPPDPNIVNIGIGFGTSSLAFYEARCDAVIFSIDKEPCEQALANWELAEIEPGRIIPIRGRSQDIGLWWPWQVDMVFVDGGHEEEEVEIDLNRWRLRVKPGGLLVFHDYGNPVCRFVKFVVDSFLPSSDLQLWLSEGYIRAFKKGE